MDRAQKAETVESLKGVFGGAGVVVVGHYSGLTVADLTVLRTRLRKEGASLKVVKNRLVKLAIDGTISIELEYAPEPAKIAAWVTEAYTATAKLMREAGLRN